MKLYRYVDHQRLHIVTKDVISLSISVLLLFRHYISHKITFGAPSSGGVLRSACGAFIKSIICKLATGEISFFLLVSVAEETGLKRAMLDTPKTGFLTMRPICNKYHNLMSWPK